MRFFYLLLALSFVCVFAYQASTWDLFDGIGGGTGGGGTAPDVEGPIFEQPGEFTSLLSASRWVNRMPMRAGGTFGSGVRGMARISFDGSGAIIERDTTLQTPRAVRLFEGDGRTRAEDVLRGMQRTTDSRDGLLRAVTFTSDRTSYETAALAGFVAKYLQDHEFTAQEQRFVTAILPIIAEQLSDHALAWLDPENQEIVFNPQLSRTIEQWIRRPKSVSAAESIYTAYVVRHELEHSVTTGSLEIDPRLRYWEEAGADTIARWPGAAADTAREMGMPYPERYVKLEYSTRRGGYPEWVTSMRLLLRAAGIDTTDPDAIGEAQELLQDRMLQEVPPEMAARIAEFQDLTPARAKNLRRSLVAFDGSARAARRIVATLPYRD